MSKKIDERRFICIMCPLGCEVTVRSDSRGEIKEIIGNKCPKGEKYSRDEFSRPMRVLTSTVSIEGAASPRLPVRTSDLIPKTRIFDCMKEIHKVKVKAPVKAGEIVAGNVLGLGINIVATRDSEREGFEPSRRIIPT